MGVFYQNTGDLSENALHIILQCNDLKIQKQVLRVVSILFPNINVLNDNITMTKEQ